MEYKVHQLCLAVPSMGDEEYSMLVTDMKTNGFRATDPIAIKEGWIIDGRHRFLAAADAGVEPVFTELDSIPWEQVPAFVASRTKRRNLTAGQRAAAASAMATKETGAAAHRDKNENSHTCTIAQACKAWGISNKYIADFRKIEQLDAELAKAVRNGSKTLNAALTEAKKKYSDKPKPEDSFEPEPEPEATPDQDEVVEEAVKKERARARESAGNNTDYTKQNEREQAKQQQEQAKAEQAKAKAQPKDDSFYKAVFDVFSKNGTIPFDVLQAPTTTPQAYALLGLLVGAHDDKVLTSKLIKLIKQHIHPDKNPTSDKHTKLFQLLGATEKLLS